MAQQIVGLINAEETDVRAVVDRATKGGPTARETIAKQLPGNKEAVAQEVSRVTAAPLTTSVLDPREVLLSATESKDFSQAYQNWILGEGLAGREFPDEQTQGAVRSGLVDTLMNQRPGGGDQFAKFLGV